MAESVNYEGIIKMLAGNYVELERSIVNQISLQVLNHHSTAGHYRETIWKSLFEMIVPKKYCIEQGVFIIDSYGNKSREVDLVIFDEMYTPYIFNYGEIKFIPIEAVAAVVQCKSKKADKIVIDEWRTSIEKLFTSMDSVARMTTRMVDNKAEEESVIKTKGNERRGNSPTQTATRPIMILCAMAEDSKLTKLKKEFDIILSVDQKKERLFKYLKGEENTLEQWNSSLNHALGDENNDNTDIKESIEKRKKLMSAEEITEDNQESLRKGTRKNLLGNLKVEQKNKDGELEENVLLSLIFQLNQLLMILNNPMLFPHHAYARCFSKILKDCKGEETDGQKK